MNFLEEESKELQMDRHMDVWIVDSEDLQTEGRKRVNMGQSYDGHLQHIFKMLQDF